ncbi:MAG TPA: p-hydroxycinnamoyl CoA hydratase/lyase [Xanthobacteraceae bacterium]|nr:p-hydroxycinnamoyl CoA hydratase/lyase [Xanthobacteraceae bacterium]
MTVSAEPAKLPGGTTVLVEIADRIAWVTMNRPEKRNAINPTMSFEMLDVFDALESDERCGVVVLTGAGDAYSSGMDLREYFRATDKLSYDERMKIMRRSATAQWKRLQFYGKPTIAMVNGWCFGGAFNSLIACDLAIAAEDAAFGLSEINWGIIPAGTVTKAVASVMGQRDCMYYIMTGETFDGRKAATVGLVNEAVPVAALRARVEKLAKTLLEKNPMALRIAKHAARRVHDMSWEDAEDYLFAKLDQLRFLDPEKGREKGMSQFLDDKSYRPGLTAYRREV